MIMNSEDLLLVGRVARPHGIRGQVIVNPETDFLEDRFRSGQVLLVGPADRPVERRDSGGQVPPGTPDSSRLPASRRWTMRSALAGSESGCRSSRWRRCRSGTFYRHDLIGCEVRDTARRAGRSRHRRRGDDRSQLPGDRRRRDDAARRRHLPRGRHGGAANRGAAARGVDRSVSIVTGASRRATRQRGHGTEGEDRHRHDLPEDGRGAARGRHRRPRDRARACSTSGCTTCASIRTTGTGSSTTCRSAAGPGWC